MRETREEAGIEIALDGIVRIEHTPGPSGARVRALFVGHPVDDRPPKRIADDESLGAAWVTLDELARYPLRGGEVAEIFAHVAAGASLYPLALLTTEGARFSGSGRT